MSADSKFLTYQRKIILNLNETKKEQKLNEQKNQQNKNPSSFLSQTLNSLNCQFIRRSNTDKNPLQRSRYLSNKHENVQHCSRQYNKTQFYTKNQSNFQPEPWNDDTEMFCPDFKPPFTQIRQKSSNFIINKKSFHIAQIKNKKSIKSKSILSHQDMRISSFNSNNNEFSTNLVSNMSQFVSQSNLRQEEIQKNLNYSSQQKIQLSLEYIIQKKKHSKMSKILKMKSQSLQKTKGKKQNLNLHSKNLIEVLEKFPSDKKLKKSIDRAVDILKKRTNNSYFSNKSVTPKKKLSAKKSFLEKTTSRWLSCHKIDPQSTSIDGSCNIINLSSVNKDQTQKQVVQIGPEKNIAIKQKCMISFKPKRNFLIERKSQKNDYKTCLNQKKRMKDKNQDQAKKKTSVGTLLKVQHQNF